MPLRFHLGMVSAAGVVLLAFTSLARAADEGGAAAPPAEVNPGDWDTIKTLLQATNEEWSVIYPQLWRIRALREDIYGNPETARPVRQRRANSVFDSPMGGTSLNEPVMPNRGGRGQNGGSSPFDPRKAPGGAETSVLSSALRGLAFRALVIMLLPDQGHPVQTVMSELKTLMESRDATDDQIREKLQAVRAVRHKALVDLETSEKELAAYLTVDQTAVLINLGLLD